MKRNQFRYIFIGTLIGWTGAFTNFPLWFDIPIPPIGNIAVSVYLLFVTYAIIKYRLMDIRLAISNTVIFVLVYLFVLGGPFYLYAVGLKLYALIVMFILATAGPFLFSEIRRRAEQKILEDQIAYQNILRSLSRGLLEVQTIEQLAKLICESLKKIMQLNFVAFFVYNPDEEKLSLAKMNGGEYEDYAREIPANSGLINILKTEKNSISQEELLHKNPGLKSQTACLNTDTYIPLQKQGRLLGLVALGKKQDGSSFTQGDLDTLNYFSTMASMAFEICLFIKAATERIKEEGAEARRRSMDMFVSTMSHEIDNPNSVVINELELIKLYVDMLKKESCDEKIYADYTSSMYHASECAKRISALVRAVEEYSKGGGELSPVKLADVMEPFHTLQLLVNKKYPGIRYHEEIEPNLPAILAEKILLEEILINFIENAYHAVSRNIAEKKVCLRIFTQNKHVRIEVEDNGYGMIQKVKDSVFISPTTTKGSAEGTGLGLYRVRQICEILKAQYGAISEGPGKGSIFYVEIPVFLGDSVDAKSNGDTLI